MGNSQEGHDHGMREYDCSGCSGKGQVVIPVAVTDQRTGEIKIIQRADYCSGCGGTGKVWR